MFPHQNNSINSSLGRFRCLLTGLRRWSMIGAWPSWPTVRGGSYLKASKGSRNWSISIERPCTSTWCLTSRDRDGVENLLRPSLRVFGLLGRIMAAVFTLAYQGKILKSWLFTRSYSSGSTREARKKGTFGWYGMFRLALVAMSPNTLQVTLFRFSNYNLVGASNNYLFMRVRIRRWDYHRINRSHS